MTVRHLRLLLGSLVLACVPGFATTAGEPEGTGLEAGFAVVDITPDRRVPLGGYAERMGRRFRSVHDPVKARAAVLRDGEETLALVSVDLVGVSRTLHETLTRRLHDLDVDNLVLAATHTHAGPGALAEAPLWRIAMGKFDRRLFIRTAARIEAAVRAAHARLAPARVAADSVRVEGLTRIRGSNPDDVDSRLGVLRIDALDGTPRGVIVHFAAHPTLLGPDVRLVSAGWPGALCDRLEREVEGTTALFLQGAMGDVSPIAPPGAGPGPFERSEAYGQSLANAALHAYLMLEDGAWGRGLEAGTTEDGHAFTIAGRLLGRDDASMLAPEHPWPLPVARFRIGSVRFQTVPGEPVWQLGLDLGQSEDRWIVSCAQDHLAYFPDRALARAADSYEAELSLFGPDVVSALADPQPYRPGPEGPVRDRHRPIRLGGRGDLPGPRAARVLGEAHGDALRGEIRDLLRGAETHLVEEVMSQGGGIVLMPVAARTRLPRRDLVVPALCRAARRLQRHIPSEYLDEMEGLARTAQVPYDAILLENVFLTLAEQPDPTAMLRLPARCTNVVAMGEATSMGQLLHGSTLDWGMRDVLKQRTVALVMEPGSGHPFVSVTWPGMVGTLRAMGAQGIAITEESCAAPEDTALDGLPVNLLMRQVVQHASGLDEAVRWIREAPGTCGYKITVSDGRALDARVVEVTARHSHVRAPAGGLLYGCDPTATCLDGPCDPAIPRNDGSSARRYPAVEARLTADASPVRLPDMKAALGLTEGRVLNDDTLLACVFEPQLGRFHLALGNDVDLDGGELRWGTHTLADHLSEQAQRHAGPPWPVDGTGEVEVRLKNASLGGIRVEEVFFESPVASGVAVNDRVMAELYSPADPEGVLIQLPHWKESREATGQRLMALAIARQGFAVLLLPLPYQYWRAPEGRGSGELTLSADLARTREAALQGAADAARASLWLEAARGYGRDRQAVVGTSLGGHVASLALGAYPERFGAGVFVLAAAGVGETMLEENGITDGIRARLLERGVTAEEAAPLVRDVDPARFARPELAERVLLVAAREDRVAPPERVEALARAWGGARIRWFDGGHYQVLRQAPQVLVAIVKHLREQHQDPR